MAVVASCHRQPIELLSWLGDWDWLPGKSMVFFFFKILLSQVKPSRLVCDTIGNGLQGVSAIRSVQLNTAATALQPHTVLNFSMMLGAARLH
jgi:hypothetical protein